MKKIYLFLAVFLSFGSIYAIKAEEVPTPVPMSNLVQIIPEDAAVSYTAAWQNVENRTDYSAEYRQKNSLTVVHAAIDGPKQPPAYDPDTPPPYNYNIRIKNLQPQTQYEYRINTADASTGWIPFTTTPENLNKYKVLIFGDSQSTEYSMWGQTAQNAWEANQDTAFFVNMGDLTDNGQAYFQWQAWYENANILTEHIPIAPVLGNHEAYSLNWKYAQPDTYETLFPVPDNGPQDQKGLAYSFNYGDVHYVSLNTDYEELHEWDPDMMETETAWLNNDLSKAQRDKKRVIVLMHRPVWYNHNLDDSNIIGQYFMPIFDKYKIPLVFTAHEHCYARTAPVTHNQRTPDGTIYITTGRSGTDAWNGSARRVFDRIYYVPMDMPMYLTLQVEPEEFHVTAYKLDGSIIDSVYIPTVNTNAGEKSLLHSIPPKK